MSNVELIKKIIEENNGILLSRELRQKKYSFTVYKSIRKGGYIVKSCSRNLCLRKRKKC